MAIANHKRDSILSGEMAISKKRLFAILSIAITSCHYERSEESLIFPLTVVRGNITFKAKVKIVPED